MSQDLRLFCIGIAAVVETALLVSLADRHNRRFIEPAMFAIVASAWLFHTAAFGSVLLVNASTSWATAAQGVSSSAMAVGLAVFPCAIIHGTWRLWRAGPTLRLDADPRASRARSWYGLAYIPSLLLLPALALIWRDKAQPFTEAVRPLTIPYVLLMISSYSGSGLTILLLRKSSESSERRRFLDSLCVVTFASATCFALVLIAPPETQNPDSPHLLFLLTIVPVLPAFLFAYFIIRHNIMRLLLEQTVVYGVIVAAAVLLHGVAVSDVTRNLESRSGIDFGLLEGLAVCLAIVAVRPWRQRASEALRYLFGTRVANVRQRARQMAVKMSRRSDLPLDELANWFRDEIEAAFRITQLSIWISDESTEQLHFSACEADPQVLRQLYDRLEQQQLDWCNRRTAPDDSVLESLVACRSHVAIRTCVDELRVLFACGQRQGFGASIGEEDVSSMRLLVEQLAVTLRNQRMREAWRSAERRALHAEKLSTLGMLASCLAHEVKNPLSTIRTIASVAGEELGAEHSQAGDLKMVVSEVDRLTDRTNELLGFARPADEGQPCDSLPRVIQSTVRFLDYAARKRGVAVQVDCNEDIPPLSVSENAIRDVLFNLILNAIEAAGTGGEVRITCQRAGTDVITTISDSGPGIASEVRARLFEPFTTTKESGTGLGLYIAARRVSELGGEISCSSGDENARQEGCSKSAGQGTTFLVKLPL